MTRPQLTPRQSPPAPMTGAERTSLTKLVNERQRVLKKMTKLRSAELLAEFERQMAQSYHYDRDEVWRQIYGDAQQAFAVTAQQTADRCRALGIPDMFSPRPYLGWSGRGENALKERRAELRKVAQTRIAADEQRANLQIDQQALQAKTEIVASGLVTEAARQFLNDMGTLERLMPPLEIADVEALLH